MIICLGKFQEKLYGGSIPPLVRSRGNFKMEGYVICNCDTFEWQLDILALKGPEPFGQHKEFYEFGVHLKDRGYDS